MMKLTFDEVFATPIGQRREAAYLLWPNIDVTAWNR